MVLVVKVGNTFVCCFSEFQGGKCDRPKPLTVPACEDSNCLLAGSQPAINVQRRPTTSDRSDQPGWRCVPVRKLPERW